MLLTSIYKYWVLLNLRYARCVLISKSRIHASSYVCWWINWVVLLEIPRRYLVGLLVALPRVFWLFMSWCLLGPSPMVWSRCFFWLIPFFLCIGFAKGSPHILWLSMAFSHRVFYTRDFIWCPFIFIFIIFTNFPKKNYKKRDAKPTGFTICLFYGEVSIA